MTGTGLVIYRSSGDFDAIDEYSRRLVRALSAGGAQAGYAADGLVSLRRGAASALWLLLQYNPFRYGRSGVAPRLVADVVALRRRVPLALMVHEAWIDMHDAKSALIGAYQRVQLRALLRLADVVMTSTQAIARELGGGALHVPVASNITPIDVTPRAARERLGLGDRLVVALFGRRNPARAYDHAEAAISALASKHGAFTVLNLGADAPPPAVPPGIQVLTPGRLSADEISLRLWASDLLLLPLTDGVSTKRTTMMAALAHGVPVLGLCGVSTDRILIEHPAALALTPVGDPAAFARAAVELVSDAKRLRAVGEAGRRLYAEQFDWPVVARRVTSALAPLAA
jgi:hypothetical protein